MVVDVHLTQREETPRWMTVAIPLLTILAALLVGALPLLVVDASPVAVYEEMFLTTLTTWDSISSVLVKLVPLTLAGLAVYLPLKAGLINIGAAGSIYVGGITATWIGLSVTGSALLALPLMVVGSAIIGAVWLFIPAYLRAKWDVNEIIVTVFMAFIAIDLNEYFIRGPLQGTTGFPASPSLPATALLPKIGGVHLGFVFVPLAVIGVWIMINKTITGYNIIMTGENPDAANQAGISKFNVFILTMVIGGALAGIGGMVQISGVQGKLISEFSPNYGFTAIPIALLGRSGADRVLLASAFFAVLFVGGISVSTTFGVPTAIIHVIEALVILFLITGEFFRRFHIDIETTGIPLGASPE